jgi:hypothetical protein
MSVFSSGIPSMNGSLLRKFPAQRRIIPCREWNSESAKAVRKLFPRPLETFSELFAM